MATSRRDRRETAPPVPALTPKLAWWQEAELLWLNHVVGPLRRRRRREPMPPPLTAEETARRLFELPVSYWTYDFEPGVRHLGPMSQDFAAAFGLGNTNRKIHMVDANGVAVIAIQALHRRVRALEAQVAELTSRLEGGEPVSANGQTAGESRPMLDGRRGTGPGGKNRRSTMDRDRSSAEDVEGHRIYNTSDRRLKHDVQPVEWEETGDRGEDVEGHRIYSGSDRNIKHDVQPVEWEEPAPGGEEPTA